MTRLLFTTAVLALLSACSSMSGGMTTDASGSSRTNQMGSSGYIGSGNDTTGAYRGSSNNGYGGGPN